MESDEIICKACQPDAAKVQPSELTQFLIENKSWNLKNETEIEKLEKKYVFSNFVQAKKFVNIVGDLAEKEGHHPSILLEYGSATINWWSHKIEGIHAKDLTLAQKTDQLFREFMK
tara:strand:- start:2 stop:349 length:348 start_codon:yes stop_codon:yes gene_type:complete